MRPMESLILAVRYKVKDMSGARVSDYEAIHCLNEGHRMLARLAAIHRPQVLAVETVAATETAVATMTVGPTLKLLDVWIDGDRVAAVPVESVDADAMGKPRGYYTVGFTGLRLVPIPDAVYSLRVLRVPEAAVLVRDSTSPWPTDLEDMVIEYAAFRIAEKGQEMFSLWHDQAVQLLSGVAPERTLVRGYFDLVPRRRDYE